MKAALRTSQGTRGLICGFIVSMRAILGVLLLTGIALPGVSESFQGSPGTQPLRHAEAIALARNGETAKALDMLGELRRLQPDDEQLLFDETVILAWADRHAEVAENAADIDPATAPAYVAEAVAKSLRDTGDFEGAAMWYRAQLEQNPQNTDSRAGLAMTYADAGQFDTARSTLLAETELDDETHFTLRTQLVEAYILEREGRLMDALAVYQRVLDANPTDGEALRSKALLLRSMLMPREALTLARQHPGLLSDDEVLQLEADVAALQIRYGAQTSYPVARHFEGIDRALEQVDTLLDRTDLDTETRTRLRYDRIVALADRLMMAEAISEFESAELDPNIVPAYVLAAIGSAYLWERQPELARQYLELALERQPNNEDIKFRLFFVYSDLREHDLATQLVEGMLADIEPINQVPGSSVIKGSSPYLRALILRGLASAYSDQLADSQEHFETLLVDLPHNTDARQELANVYRWRGWIDRSLAEYSQVLAVEPGLVSARIGKTYTMLDNRDYARAEQEILDLQSQYGFEPGVHLLAKHWQDHNRQEILVESNFGESSGDTFGQDQYELNAAWYSMPLAYRYRAFFTTHDAYAEFPEGSEHRRRASAGVEYRYTRWLATAAISADRDGGGAGIRGGINYRLNDFLNIGGRLETHSNSMPLRGERLGISSDLVAIEATYARHESTTVQGSLSYQDISDGNTASSLFVGAEQRLVNHQDYKLTLLGELFAENRKLEDVAYYSPRHVFTWMLGLRNDWLMFRRYDFALSHSLTGYAGRYHQAGFDTGTNWNLEYRFQTDFNARWNGYFGLKHGSNVYDGTRETATFFLAGLGGRF